MDLQSQLMQDLKAAMKAKDKTKLNVIRMIKTALMNKKIEQGSLSHQDELAVLTSQLKQRQESLAEFKKAQRTELAQETEAEIKIVQQYLPQPLTDAELDQIIDQVINEQQAHSMKDMGKVMPAVMTKVTGRAAGGVVSQKVRAKLAK